MELQRLALDQGCRKASHCGVKDGQEQVLRMCRYVLGRHAAEEPVELSSGIDRQIRGIWTRR